MGVRGPAAGRGWGGFACSRVIRTTSVLVLVLAWVLGAGVSEARTAPPSGIPTATWVEQAPIPTWFDIQGIDAVSATEAWIASAPLLGDEGELAHTTDAGRTWTVVEMPRQVNAVFFNSLISSCAVGLRCRR